MAAPISPARLVPRPVPALPVDRLVFGKPVEEVVELLPRLFNLCKAAQGLAVRAALGIEPGPGDLREEILRDHLMRLFIVLPGRLGMGAWALPPDWQTDDGAVASAVFGPTARAPETGEDMLAFLESGYGVAPILARIATAFRSGEATAVLELVRPSQALDRVPVENSVATRHASHPAMQALENAFGRGPLWRVAARAFDIAACLDGALPEPVRPSPGTAVVPATRGLYSVRAIAEHGHVTHFSRTTPTDHLLVANGVLDRSLATLPADRTGLAPLLLDILDPCSPVRLEEAAHA